MLESYVRLVFTISDTEYIETSSFQKVLLFSTDVKPSQYQVLFTFTMKIYNFLNIILKANVYKSRTSLIYMLYEF